MNSKFVGKHGGVRGIMQQSSLRALHKSLCGGVKCSSLDYLLKLIYLRLPGDQQSIVGIQATAKNCLLLHTKCKQPFPKGKLNCF